MRVGILLRHGKYLHHRIFHDMKVRGHIFVTGVSILLIGFWKCSTSIFFHLLIDVLVSIDKEHGRENIELGRYKKILFKSKLVFASCSFIRSPK